MLETLTSAVAAGDQNRASAVTESYADDPRFSILYELAFSLGSASEPSSVRSILTSINSSIAGADRLRCLHALSSTLFDTFFKIGKLAMDLTYRRLTIGIEESVDIFESQRLCCEIFCSLNPAEFPQFSGHHTASWMHPFIHQLSAGYADAIEGTGVVDSLRAAIYKTLQLAMETNEETFVCHASTSIPVVYIFLTTSYPRAPPSPARDQLMVNAIMFMTAAASRCVRHRSFWSTGVIQEICHLVVFPNLMHREEDYDKVSATNYFGRLNLICNEEGTSTDVKWCNIEARRRILCELLKGIALNFKARVMELVTGQIQNMLSMYATNPKENWRHKDCAYYLAASLRAAQMELVDVESLFAEPQNPKVHCG